MNMISIFIIYSEFVQLLSHMLLTHPDHIRRITGPVLILARIFVKFLQQCNTVLISNN